jgi:hypothetical protein
MSTNHRITGSGPLLDEHGRLREAGYALRPPFEYAHDRIAAHRIRIKDWDYYLVQDAEYAVEGVQSGKQLFFPSLEAGTWYVGVQCESVPTVTDNHGTYGTEYSNTGILNGAPYTVQVSWDYE